MIKSSGKIAELEKQAYQEAVEQMQERYGELKIFGEYRSRKG